MDGRRVELVAAGVERLPPHCPQGRVLVQSRPPGLLAWCLARVTESWRRAQAQEQKPSDLQRHVRELHQGERRSTKRKAPRASDGSSSASAQQVARAAPATRQAPREHNAPSAASVQQAACSPPSSQPVQVAEAEHDECPICYEHVTLQTLPCGHCVCAECVGKIAGKSAYRQLRVTAALDCPFCRRQTRTKRVRV